MKYQFLKISITMLSISIFMTACSSKNTPKINSQEINISNNSHNNNHEEIDEFDDEFKSADKEVFDPLEGYNRWMTSVNDRFYIYMFDPVSRGYAFVVPKPTRIGLAAGPHLALPFFGPSNLRDAIGFSVDSAIAPTTNASLKYQIPDNTEKALGLSAFYYLNKNSLHPGGYENLKKDALHLYTFFRDSYEQKRAKDIEK